jgi:hypothetical protein
MQKNTQILIIAALAVAGFCFKLWFISLAPQPVIWDQDEYLIYARNIIASGLYGTTSRTYVYPMFLALHFLLFGMNNYRAIYVSHAVCDTLTGLMLYLLANRIFRSRRIAMTAYVMQLFNPFTTGYVGVILSEITATALVVLTALSFDLSTAKSKIKPLMLLLFGLAGGLLVENRPMYIWWFIPVLTIGPWLTAAKRLIIPSMVVTLLGFLLAVTYQFVGNIILFHEASLVSVDSQFAREFYDGAILHVAPLFPDAS